MFQSKLKEGELKQLVLDLVKVVKVLKEENRYPAFDMLRVICLTHAGVSEVLALAEFQEVINIVLESKSKLSFMAGLRLVQNLLMSPNSILATPPHDVSISKVSHSLISIIAIFDLSWIVCL